MARVARLSEPDCIRLLAASTLSCFSVSLHPPHALPLLDLAAWIDCVWPVRTLSCIRLSLQLQSLQAHHAARKAWCMQGNAAE